MNNYQITMHFSFFEMTSTSESDLQEQNRDVNEAQLKNAQLLCNMLEKVRSLFNKPISITSGFRSESLNARIGGSNNSQHMKFQAADFYIAYEDVCDVFNAIMESDLFFGQLILYSDRNFIHISIGTRREIYMYKNADGFVPIEVI